jgi:Na+/melibiose symporter-like transporter
MNLDTIADFSFVRPLVPLLGLLLFLAAALPFLRRPGKKRFFFAALGLFFCGTAAVFLLLGQPIAAVSMFFVPALLYGIFRKAGRGKK